MTKPQLTVGALIESGFDEVGCWELDNALDLTHSIDLPVQSGVYAFAIDGVVQYVGLASKSVRQRLGFYRKPGVSQRTNIRLNEIIRGHLSEGTVVQILIAHPPDHIWNGFTVKGAEGLEAGIIAAFELPWNMRGAQPVRPPKEKSASVRPARTGNVGNNIIELVRRRPGMTELEIAKAIYGPSAVQPQVNEQCRALVKAGRMVRHGAGGAGDPFVYRIRN